MGRSLFDISELSALNVQGLAHGRQSIVDEIKHLGYLSLEAQLQNLEGICLSEASITAHRQNYKILA